MARPAGRNEPPVLLVKWYDVTKWLLERVDSFPKNQRGRKAPAFAKAWEDRRKCYDQDSRNLECGDSTPLWLVAERRFVPFRRSAVNPILASPPARTNRSP